MDYKEELKYNKQERDRIKAEINDLESRIIIESGRRHRFEVNAYRDRVNRLKMRLNEISLRISEIENMFGNLNSHGQIQMSADCLDIPLVRNGEICVTDSIEFDRGYSDRGGETIQSVTRTVEKTIIFKNNKPVSYKEVYNETVTTKKLGGGDTISVRSSIIE